MNNAQWTEKVERRGPGKGVEPREEESSWGSPPPTQTRGAELQHNKSAAEGKTTFQSSEEKENAAVGVCEKEASTTVTARN